MILLDLKIVKIDLINILLKLKIVLNYQLNLAISSIIYNKKILIIKFVINPYQKKFKYEIYNKFLILFNNFVDQ